MAAATPTTPTPNPSGTRYRNRYRDSRTEIIHAEAECWLWILTEIDADLENEPGSWTFPEESKRYVLAAIEEINEELARRERLRARPGAPSWPRSWPDRRPHAAAIKARVHLGEFIERTTSARFGRSGKELLGRCPHPAHEDNHPSFRVNEAKGLFRCWGCGWSGDLFTFTAELLTDGGTFLEALDVIAAYLDREARFEARRLEVVGNG